MTSSSIAIVRVPLGPLTVSVPSSAVAVTPPGIGMGFLPMRDILEYLRQQLAADVLLARLGIREHAARGRDDHRPEPVADVRQLAGAGVDPAAGPGDARQMVDRRLALEIFEVDPQAFLARQLLFRIAADIAFALKHI